MKAIATELSDLASVGQALRGLGETARLLGRHRDAITYCREALALQRQRQADTGEIARALFFCALSYSYGGYPSDAIDCSEEALVLAQQAQDVANIARAHDALALANLMLERWEEAIAHARSAIEGDTKVQSLDGICFVGNVEAMALFGAGRHEEALRVFERVVRESNEYDMPRALALCLFNQARALRALNRADAAVDTARAALAIMVESRFSAIETAQSLVDALVAAASGDRHGELRRLLDCARTSLANPDLYPPGDLIREVRAAAVDAQLDAVAAEAADLDAIVRSRQHARWEARDAGVPPTS
jgi:tetratricopeptide (TPR) repeat protein